MENKILIVDDDLWMTKVLNKTIKNIGYSDTAIVHNGIEAVSTALEYAPELIILDLVMPELDGLTTLKLLKNITSTQSIKIIICSGNNDVENLAKAMKLGAADFIAKPFSAETIKEKIELVLSSIAKNQ